MPVRRPTEMGARLRELRQAAALKHRELDRLAGITEGHARMIETGVVTNACIHTVTKLARVFGASLDWFVAGNGRAPSARTLRSAVKSARDEYVARRTGARRTGARRSGARRTGA